VHFDYDGGYINLTGEKQVQGQTGNDHKDRDSNQQEENENDDDQQ
jgi:hypothetical protein